MIRFLSAHTRNENILTRSRHRIGHCNLTDFSSRELFSRRFAERDGEASLPRSLRRNRLKIPGEPREETWQILRSRKGRFNDSSQTKCCCFLDFYQQRGSEKRQNAVVTRLTMKREVAWTNGSKKRFDRGWKSRKAVGADVQRRDRDFIKNSYTTVPDKIHY